MLDNILFRPPLTTLALLLIFSIIPKEHIMNTSRKFLLGLLVLLFGAMLFVMLGVFLMPHSLVKIRMCSTLRGSLLSDVCSSSELQLLTSGSSIRNSSENTNFKNTMDIATSIYVVSLPKRTDRRKVMDVLKGALNLNWTYFDALDKDNPLIDKIMYSTATRREDTTSAFKWPETHGDASPSDILESLIYDGLPTSNAPLAPLICATGDDTIPSYVNASSIPFHQKLSRGMIACWYSHVRLMSDIVKRTSHIHADSWDGKEGVTAIFEDDIDVEWDLKDRVKKMWVDLPTDWDVVMLGHCWSNESTYPPIIPTSPLHPSYRPKCTHGYVLSPFGARRLLTHLTYPPFSFSRALDQAIAHLISTHRIRSFSVVPSIVVQRRCPLDDSKECHYDAALDGDSDIWVNGGRKGSQWRDTLEDSALERTHSSAVGGFD